MTTDIHSKFIAVESHYEGHRRDINDLDIREYVDERITAIGGGSSYLPLDLTDDVTPIINTLDESWGSVLNVTQDAATWFQGFRLGNFDADHWNGGFEGFTNPGYELSISDKATNDGSANYSAIRGSHNTIVFEVFDATNNQRTGDFQIGNPQILLASYDNNGNQGVEFRTRISPDYRMLLDAYDEVNESEIEIFPDRVLTTFAEKNGNPDATDIPDGYYGVYKNTSGGAIKLWVNDGGIFKSIAFA